MKIPSIYLIVSACKKVRLRSYEILLCVPLYMVPIFSKNSNFLIFRSVDFLGV